MAGDEQVVCVGRDRRRFVTRRRAAVVLGAIALGIAIGVGIALVRAGALSKAAVWFRTPAYEARGRLVPLPDGRRLYLDCRGTGSPTVVFESGLGGGADGWGTVFPETAMVTRACVYDRANLGRSDPAARRSGSATATDLWAALDAAGERGPFVLVGHSLGGAYVRLAAADRPSEVAGLVLVDAFNPDLFVGDAVALPADVAARWNAGMEATYRTIEAVEGLDWAATMSDLASVRLGSIPVIALTQPDRWGEDKSLSPALVAELRAAWEAGFASMSTRVRHTVVPDTGHLIQFDRPDAVLAAIHELVEDARR